MGDFFQHYSWSALVLTLSIYSVSLWVKRRFKHALLNPLLWTIVALMLLLSLTQTPYDDYKKGVQLLVDLLTPVTICLAVPLYKQLETLKRQWKIILLSVTTGVLSSLLSIWGLSQIFRLSKALYISLLPKSITTAIGLGLSEELGGIATLTVALIVLTGISGNVLAEQFCRLIRLQHPVAKGLAIGSASHAIGTAKAIEMGEVEGAMSSLALVLSGLLTVVVAPFFVPLF